MYAKKDLFLQDPLWGNATIQKFINRLMYSGKKSVAEKVFYQAMASIQMKTGKNPLHITLDSIEMVKPYVEVRSIRVAGSTYMVPVEIQAERQLSLALRWLKKKEEVHKMAEANRAFSHYRW